jgi:hypothetical protein
MITKTACLAMGVVMLMGAAARCDNDIGFVEQFSLASDRGAQLEQLIPGTEDYYYYHCLYYQHTGDYRNFHQTLNQWIKRYRYTPRVREMQNRQALLEYETDPDKTLAHIRDRLNLHFSHQKRVLDKTTHHPTSLNQNLISRETLTERAYRDHDQNLHGFEETGLLYLDGRKLSDDRRRDLLKRLTRPDVPHLPQLIVQDLRYKHSGGFGSIDIHNKLLLAQLDECLKLMPDLIANTNFINTYLKRLHPSADADWKHNTTEHEAFLDRLWSFAAKLPPVQNSLKAHVLFHRLNFDRSRGLYDPDRFTAYIKLPRNMFYVEPAYLQRPEHRHVRANLNASFEAYTLLPPVIGDEPLVRDYLEHFLKDAASYRPYADYIDDNYLKRVYAETKIVNGVGDMEQWYSLLTPQQVKDLKERVDLEFLPANPEVFRQDDPVELELAVKNVEKLIVKIYEINTMNYYRKHQSEISTGIDLDGLVANMERTVTYNTVPLRQHVERFAFPEIDRPGVFVVEFIGNGRSSRALVRKGRLAFTERPGAGGHVFSVYDEKNRKLDDCTLWLSGHEYPSDKDGDIAVPYSNQPGRQPIVLTHNGFSALHTFNHLAEAYRLDAGFYIDRESLVDGETARLIVRPLLTVNNMPVDVKLLEDTTLTLRTTDQDDISSSLELEDFELFNDRESVHEFKVPPNLSHIAVTLQGRIRNLSKAQDENLSAALSLALNQIDKSEKTEDLLLRRVADQYLLQVLGKTGESRPDRPVHFSIKHRDFRRTVECTLQTDEAGRILLGPLQDIEHIQARGENGVAHIWHLTRDRHSHPPVLHSTTQLPLLVPIMHESLEAPHLAFSLLEVRNGVFFKDWSDHAAIENGYLAARDLPAGDYDLLLRQSGDQITVKLTDGKLANRYAQSDTRHLEVREVLPLQIRSVTRKDRDLVVQLAHAGPAARVHVIATRFMPAFSPFRHLDVLSEPGLAANRIEPPESRYVSGRNIGDEYRYILERRYAKRFPGNMLNRPSLILNPWSPRKTDTGTDEAEEGEAWSDDKRDQSRLYGSRQPGARGSALGGAGGGLTDFASLDFLPSGSVVLANLQPERNGAVRVALDALGSCQQVHVVAADGWNTVYRETTLDDRDESYRDLRLTRPLDPEKHFAEQKAVSPVLPTSQLVIDDITTSEMEVYDTLGKVYSLFMTLTGDETLAKFGFVLNWPSFEEARKRELYSEYACHELNLFLCHKDPAFFKDVVQPYLRNKKDKTFMDDWFIGEDLTPYFRPWHYQRLNMMERVLLGKRVAAERAAMQRHVKDRFDLVPPDIERFNRLFRTALQGRALETGDAFGWDAAETAAQEMADRSVAFGPAPAQFKSVALVKSPVLMRKMSEMGSALREEPALVTVDVAPDAPVDMDALVAAEGGLSAERLRRQDTEYRKKARIFYRKLDKTREWVENNYYHQPVEAQLAELVSVNAFWKDYAEHAGKGPFLSSNVAEATHSFTEMLCALAVLDLPFKAKDHDAKYDGARMLLFPGSPAVVFHKQIKEAHVAEDRPDLLVSQSYFAQDDRYRYENNERFDKFVTREFLAARVYGAQVVLTNPTSAPRKVDVLLQIPPGAVPVLNGFYTRSLHRRLEAYSTQTIEYCFYFPRPGRYAQFPVHVAENEAVVARTKPFVFNVVPKLTEIDKTSWPYLSQNGSDEEVLAYLREHNIDRLNLDEIAFRMRDREFFLAVTPLLQDRHVYNHTLWSYGIYHKDVPVIREYLKHSPYANQCGLFIDSALLTLDPIERHVYQHKEYWPLVNARVYPLGGKRKILNDQFYQQYMQFMAFLAYRPELNADDRLGVATYLLLQDRVEEALRCFDSIDIQDTEMALQADYMRAYLAFSRSDPAAARKIAARYKDHPVDRWRERFADVLAQVDEIEGGAVRVVDDEDRMQQQTRLADTAPALDIKVENREIELHVRNLETCRINYYPVDIELLFSRNPFVQDEGSQFSIVRPDKTDTIKLPDKGTRTIALPVEYHDRNVMVEVTGGGITRAQAYYPHSLAAQVSENYGQVRVTHARTGKPVVQAYVKIYARMKDGSVRFFKDGYTDLRGRFDYTSLNTNELEFVDRFAILIMSEADGAVVRVAAPPKR